MFILRFVLTDSREIRSIIYKKEKTLKKYKFIILLSLSLIFASSAFAGDYSLNSQSIDYTDNPDIESTVGVDSITGGTLFEDGNTKVIKTKNKFFKGWKFGKWKKKKNENVDKPIVIDYDYDTETEEIIPVVQETKTEDKVKEEIKNSKETPAVAGSNINVYCDNMEYFEDKKEIVGTGNAKVVFTDSNSVMSAEKIVFNHDLNYIEGIGNVRMTKDDQVMDGDYTKVDLNYGNAMIDNPVINNYMVKVIAKKGSMSTDSIEAYDGVAVAKQNYEKRVYSAQYASFFPMEVNDNMYRRFYPKEYRYKGTKYHIKTKELHVNSTEGHDTITFKNADIYAGKVLLMKGADMSLSTDKDQAFVETTLPEIGSMRYVGSYFGPGFVFNTPFSSTLKVAPLVTLDGGKFGVGILARFRQKRNNTQLMYSTGANKLVLRGRQQFGDSDFYAEYAHMSYINDWFLGSNISRYLAQVAYQKRYVMPDIGMTFSHRATAGYLTDEFGHTGTARFRYQAMMTKNILEYRNYDRKTYAALDLVTQGVMGVYGTGDTLGVFRIGPSIRTQYRGWGQRIAYYQSAKGGGSPLKYTDDYRYGNATVQLIETLRLNKYITLGYYAALNLQNNDPTTRNMFSESRVMVSFGPEDARLSFGYDMIRQATMLHYTALIGSKNQDISFKKLFIKNPDKIATSEKKKKRKEKEKEKALKKQIEQSKEINSQNNNVIPEDSDIDNIMETPAIFNFGGK